MMPCPAESVSCSMVAPPHSIPRATDDGVAGLVDWRREVPPKQVCPGWPTDTGCDSDRLIGSEIGIMAGKSPVRADEDQRSALIALSRSRDRSEADRARAILLTLSGWTSRQIAEAFGVREDTVRFWRSAFTAGGIEALKTAVAPGPAPVKAERALAVAEEV